MTRGRNLDFLGDLLDSTIDAVFAVDEHWRLTYLNRRAREEIFGGKGCLTTLWDAYPALLNTAAEHACRQALAERRQVWFELYHENNATWHEVAASPAPNGGLVFCCRYVQHRERIMDDLRRAEESYRLAASAAADLLIDWNLATDEIVWRQAVPSGFGEAILVSHDWCVAQVHPDDRAAVSAAIQTCLRTGERTACDCRVRNPDGNYADVRQTVVLQRDSDNRPVRLIIATRNMTDWKRASETVRQREAELANIFSQALVGILESAPDGRVRQINNRFCQILGRSQKDLIGADVLEFTHPDDIAWNQELYRNQQRQGEPFQLEKRYVRPDGSVVWCRESVSFVRAPTGEIANSITVAEDVTHQRQAADQLKWASEHDGLTALANRRAFEGRLQAATLRAMLSKATVGLLLLDLDHFKHVNDSFGHQAGDGLLRQVGKRLAETVEPHGFVARLGGDEFAVLVEEPAGGFQPTVLGEAILRELRRPFQIEGRAVTITASIGGAVFPADAESAHELFKHADLALYELKNGGRGGTRRFHPAMLDHALVVASQLDLARSAVCERSVDPHYQPKVDLRTGRIVGFEALLRWHHGLEGLQAPDSVAEAFRDYELASKIGGLMQRHVLADLRGWLQQGLPVGCVAINAAPAEFLRDDFAERLLKLLQEHEVPASMVEIEITEHVFFDQGASFVGRALELLSRSGVRIALDDFGTGYSSLSHLRDFPVNVVKIDRSFVEHVTSDSGTRAIISAIAALASSLGIDLVAEGVETERQRLMLLEQGCPLGQGYHFGRPKAADSVPALVLGAQPGSRKSA